MSLTVYLVERGGDAEKTKESLIGLPNVIIENKAKGTPCTGFHKCETDWYMILFDDEVLDQRLVNAIPIFMEADYDYYNLSRIMITEQGQRFFVNPRLFRKDVVLNRHGEPSSDYVSTNILDGFIFVNSNA